MGLFRLLSVLGALLTTQAHPSPSNLSDFITISSVPASYRDSTILGSIPFKVSVIGPRASDYIYAPAAAFAATNATGAKLTLIVKAHSTSRYAEQRRDSLIDFADTSGAAVLVPLFLYGVEDPNDADNCKEVLYREIRYDEIPLGMLRGVAVRWEGLIDTEKLYLTAFSGGGQFAQRFLYLHLEGSRAAIVAAPGMVTTLNEIAWLVGVRDVEGLFEREFDVERTREVNLHLMVVKLHTGVAKEGLIMLLGARRGRCGGFVYCRD